MEFVIGTRVEVIQREPSLEGAYFVEVVIDRTPGMRKVGFETLLNNDGTPLEESISMRRLRPCPPEVKARFMVGDIVDACHNDGWWPGRYIRRDGNNYKVKFENMDPPKPNDFLYQTSYTLPSRVVGDNKPIKRNH